MKDAIAIHAKLPVFFLTFFCLVLFAFAAQARDVTFTWTANAEQVDSYQLYYKASTTGGIPYDGTGATEGNSPVNTGNVTTFTLHGLSDAETYYFVLTAKAGTLESDYSAELILDPLPDQSGDAPPVASGSNISTTENQVASGSVTASNDTGLPINYYVQQGVSHGVLFLETGDGNFTYTPAQDFSGSDSFTFLGRDDNGDSNIATVNITITATNDPPTATNTTLTVNEDSSATGQLQAQDPNADTLTYSIVTNPAHGTATTVNSNGTFTYTPDTDFSGTDSFTFTVNDGQTTSNSATVSITITAINDPPTAEPVAITVSEDSSVNGQLQAQDPDNTSLTYSVVAHPTHGSVTANTSGGFTYSPEANATGTDNFTFQVSDGQALSNTATVSITISPINDAPVALAGSLNAPFEQTTSGTLQANDLDNDPLTYSLASDPQQVVTITNSTAGAYTFTPVDGMESPYTFTFTVNDGATDSNSATVTVTLLETNTLTEIFGDTPESNHPGTLTDTFTDVNDSINASTDHISTWSWSSPTPHKPANTIIIKTDLTSLKKTIKITEAKLYLYQTSATGEATYNNSIHKITGKNPIIAQITGNNAYNGELWTPVEAGITSGDIPLGLADIGPAEDTVALGTGAGYQTWLITEMVQNWIKDSGTNYGLLITGVPTATETGRTFAASENENVSFRPKLVIRYIGKPHRPTVISAEQIQ